MNFHRKNIVSSPAKTVPNLSSSKPRRGLSCRFSKAMTCCGCLKKCELSPSHHEFQDVSMIQWLRWFGFFYCFLIWLSQWHWPACHGHFRDIRGTMMIIGHTTHVESSKTWKACKTTIISNINIWKPRPTAYSLEDNPEDRPWNPWIEIAMENHLQTPISFGISEVKPVNSVKNRWANHQHHAWLINSSQLINYDSL